MGRRIMMNDKLQIRTMVVSFSLAYGQILGRVSRSVKTKSERIAFNGDMSLPGESPAVRKSAHKPL